VGASGQLASHDPSGRSGAACAEDTPTTNAWFPALYDCLHDLAERRFRHEAAGHTLQPTALVHEAYVGLAEADPGRWRDRNHFFAVAARALREVLVDHARRRRAVKRGGGWCRVTLHEGVGAAERSVDLVALDDALTRLSLDHSRAARVVELRFFGGLSIDETAAALDVSIGTVKSDWRFARAWLNHTLEEEAP
jgi:RNA polymerase sigma factor (TIGR02999 family)